MLKSLIKCKALIPRQNLGLSEGLLHALSGTLERSPFLCAVKSLQQPLSDLNVKPFLTANLKNSYLLGKANLFFLPVTFLKEGMSLTGRDNLASAVADSLAVDCVTTSEYVSVILKFKEERAYLCFNSIYKYRKRQVLFLCKRQEMKEIIKQAGNSGLQSDLTKIALCTQFCTRRLL